MKTKKKYIAPTLKRYAYKVEGGFANSSMILNNIDPNGIYDDGFERWGWTSGGNENEDNRLGGSNNGNWSWDL